jgi:hypothetical protein
MQRALQENLLFFTGKKIKNGSHYLTIFDEKGRKNAGLFSSHEM